MKKISILLILIGLLVASYPLAEKLFTWYWQMRLMAEWDTPAQMAITSAGIPSVEKENLKILETLVSEGQPPQKEKAKNPLTPQGEVMGVLGIDSINVKLPIIKGLNETNLKIGVVYLVDTPPFGAEGNTVLAGHRGNSAGRLLNRLNEVKLNDKILVTGKNSTYQYTVYNIVIVKPEETEILRSKKDEKILTLVACEPVYKPTHRLIVQARLDT